MPDKPIKIDKYHILFYGGPEGYMDRRARIALVDTSGETVAIVDFMDQGMSFRVDYESDGLIWMHLPSNMFQNVLDVLKNEESVYVCYKESQAFLSTSIYPLKMLHCDVD